MDKRTSQSLRITIIGLVLNVLLALLKIIAGIIGRSAAIIADAVHSLSDFGTDVAVIWGLRAASKPADKDHDYGHGKVEALIAALIGVVLCGVGLNILWRGIALIALTVHGHSLNEPGWIAFYAAVVSIVTKEWLYRRTIAVGTANDSQVIIANAWHHRSDALSSIGVMLGIGGAIVLGGTWRVLDPIAAVIVSAIIIKTAVSICFESANELIDASLSDEIEAEIIRLIKTVAGADKPHNLRTRRIGKNVAIEIHIKVDKHLNITQGHDIATAVEQTLKKRFGRATFVSVHIEPL